jgi:HSP20 family protein
MDPEQVDVTADNGVLTVRGEKPPRERKEGEEGRYHVVERTYGSFVRAFQLPQNAEEERITADYRNGVLTVTVPKTQRPQPRKIRIGGDSTAAIQDGARARQDGEPRAGTRSAATKSAAAS